MSDLPVAPTARKHAFTHKKHGHHREDNYHWMSQRDKPEVMEHLQAENDYYDQVTAHTQDLQKELFEEIKSRIKEDDESVPYKYHGYWYYAKYEKGDSYPRYYRKKKTLEAAAELLLDVNEMAEGHDFYHLTGLSISPDSKRLAFSVDVTGRRQYHLYVKELSDGAITDTGVDHVSGSSTWATDNTTLFYAKNDPKTLRSYRIYRKYIDRAGGKEHLVYEEKDEGYHCFVYKSKSEQYLYLKSTSTMTDEISFLPADKPRQEPVIFQERTPGLEYGVSHYGDHFYILTNYDGADNFQIMRCDLDRTTADHWEILIAHDPEVLLEGMDIFAEHLVISDRHNGLNRLRIRRWDGTADYFVDFSSETYTVHTSTNPDFDTTKLRYSFTALETPATVIEMDMETREKRVLKEQEVQDKAFAKENYAAQRIWATAEDGARIPISLVYRKDLRKEKGNPLLVYGYGSYGHTIDPHFSVSRLSLLDRGFIYAIAHVRGGEYMGRHWYEKGKMMHKRNTFTDFISCTRHLQQQGYSDPDKTYAYGGSAGGLLMGAILNMAPSLYNGIVAAVPFVDVVTTMLDASIPLTTGEYDEWGNPEDKAAYDYILSYSPYDNVNDRDYPSVLVTTGYHDSQVQYWEPAKWVARLRDHQTGEGKILFKVDIKSGHSGASGRYDSIKDIVTNYAYIIDLERSKEY